MRTWGENLKPHTDSNLNSGLNHNTGAVRRQHCAILSTQCNFFKYFNAHDYVLHCENVLNSYTYTDRSSVLSFFLKNVLNTGCCYNKICLS